MSLAFSSFPAPPSSYGGAYTTQAQAGGFALVPPGQQASLAAGQPYGQAASGQAGNGLHGLMGQMLQMMQLMLQVIGGTLFGGGSGGNGVSPAPGQTGQPTAQQGTQTQNDGSVASFIKGLGPLDKSAIDPLLLTYANLDPASSDARFVEQTLEGLQPGIMAGERGLKARQLQIAYVQAALYSVAANVVPGTPEARQLDQASHLLALKSSQIDLAYQTTQNDKAITGLLASPGSTPGEQQYSQSLIQVLQAQKVRMAELSGQLQQKLDSTLRV